MKVHLRFVRRGVLLVVGVIAALMATSLPASAVPISARTVTGPSISLTLAGPAPNEAHWNATAVRKALAAGDSLNVALAAGGLPPITASSVRSTSVRSSTGRSSTGRMRADGAGYTCIGWSCGYEFSAVTSYEMAWLVWAGIIVGPGLICSVLGTGTVGIACLVAASLWALVSAYVAAPPPYTGLCIFSYYSFYGPGGFSSRWVNC